MVEIWLPYGKTEVPVRIPDEALLAVIDVEEIPSPENLSRQILKAIDVARLDEIVKPGHKVAITVDSDLFPHTLVLPLLLEKLSSLGVKESETTILLGNTLTEADYRSKLMSEEFAKRVNILTSSPDTKSVTYIGNTRRGTKVWVETRFVEADLRILTGRIGFHPHAGYIGGRSGILPAICGVETIRSSFVSILDPKSRIGNLEENLLHQEMQDIAQLAKVNCILNVVLNSRGDVINFFAGAPDQAFLEGIKFVDETFRTFTETRADIVIVSSGGFPWDTTLFRACEGLVSALNVVKDGGVIIWVAECSRGHGNSVFYDWMTDCKTAEHAAIKIKKGFMVGGDRAYLMLQTLEKVKIILVSVLPSYYTTEIFKLRTAKTVYEALNLAFRLLGKKGKILVLPHGNTVLPEIKKGNGSH